MSGEVVFESSPNMGSVPFVPAGRAQSWHHHAYVPAPASTGHVTAQAQGMVEDQR